MKKAVILIESEVPKLGYCLDSKRLEIQNGEISTSYWRTSVVTGKDQIAENIYRITTVDEEYLVYIDKESR